MGIAGAEDSWWYAGRPAGGGEGAESLVDSGRPPGSGGMRGVGRTGRFAGCGGGTGPPAGERATRGSAVLAGGEGGHWWRALAASLMS